MPICGSLSIPPGYIERVLSYNSCIIVPSGTPLATQPLYQSGQFVSANPNATATRVETDRDGRTTLTIGTASQGILAQICTSNCGAGTGFFGLGGSAADIARLVGGIVVQVAGAVSPAAPFIAAGQALSENVERSQQGMALNLSGILGAVGGVLSGANLGQYSVLGQIGGAGLNIASAALAPTPQMMPLATPVYGPVYGPPAPMAQPPVVRTMSGSQALAVGSAAIAAAKAILPKIAAALGRKGITLSRAVELARKLGKFFTSPEAIALYMGISVAELAQIITAHSSRKRRRMNPANAHALRRAARRIKSFHRLCTHTDLVRRSRSRSVARCGTCRKSPCRC